MKVYWKGKLLPWKETAVSPLNSGLFFGENIFEAVPVYGGKGLFLREHIERLKRGCDFLQWTCPPKKRFEKAINLFYKDGDPSANFMIRFNLVQELRDQINPRIFLGGVPALFATTRPLRHDPASVSPLRGQVGISPWTAADSKTIPNRFKISFYLTTRSVFREHPQWDEVLRLNGRGEVVDGGLSTPMWFDGREVRVPPLSLGGLESVTRMKTMSLCKRLGIRIAEKPWRPEAIFRKGELFFVGSGVGVMSPTSLGGRRINRRPFLADRLWQYYRKLALR